MAATIAVSGTELVVRGCAYVLLLALACLMLRGSNVARHLLTAIYGALGTFSLVVEPIRWMIGGGNVIDFLADADTAEWLIITSRIAHIAAVLGGVWLAYRSDASDYFGGRGYASSTVARRPKGPLRTWPGPQDRKIEGRKLWASLNVSNDAAEFSLTASLIFPAAPALRNRLDWGALPHRRLVRWQDYF